jgi:HEPN domain-containing protein
MERGKYRDEWKELVGIRMADAEVLVKDGSYDAAYYLAGYAVECALKARIVRILEGYFPPRQSLYTHSLKNLVDAAELGQTFTERSVADPRFSDRWEIVKHWSEESRYETHDRKAAEDMLEAARGAVECIREYW